MGNHLYCNSYINFKSMRFANRTTNPYYTFKVRMSVTNSDLINILLGETSSINTIRYSKIIRNYDI